MVTAGKYFLFMEQKWEDEVYFNFIGEYPSIAHEQLAKALDKYKSSKKFKIIFGQTCCIECIQEGSLKKSAIIDLSPFTKLLEEG